jgi:hypothetical protein
MRKFLSDLHGVSRREAGREHRCELRIALAERDVSPLRIANWFDLSPQFLCFVARATKILSKVTITIKNQS